MDHVLRFAYTPDPDDAFHYYALENKKIPWPAGMKFIFRRGPIHDLNNLADQEEVDVCAISSVFYPKIDRRYVLLASGASVGRNYGPLLACRGDRKLDGLEGSRVGIPGYSTTGFFLLRFFYRDFEPVPMPFNKIADAIEEGEVDAGVLIHEELLNYRERQIRKICCLGQRWYRETGLPLPVGLNVVRRKLGGEMIQVIENLLFESMQYALNHPLEAMTFAKQFGRGPVSRVRDEFIRKFANEDTLCMPEDVRQGLRALYKRAYGRGFVDHIPDAYIVDPLSIEICYP